MAVSIAAVDRPLALWLADQFEGTATFAAAAALLRPLDGVFATGLLLVVVSLVARRVLRVPPPLLRLISGSGAMTAAVVTALALKIAIGRSQVVPGFLDHHIYQLRPFAISEMYMSFPSATMAGVSAFMFGVGARSAAARAASAGVLLLLAAALLVTNGHWLSDIIGGAALGHFIGLQTSAIADRRSNIAHSPIPTSPMNRGGR